MKIIILNNKKCQCVTADEQLLKKLINKLSFKQEGVEYTPAYQMGGWNGITYLMTKNGKFDLGLLNTVKRFLEEKNVEYTVEDRRPPKVKMPELDISENLKIHNLIPREHQEKVRDLVDIYDRGIVRVATGGGKTLITALMTAKLNKKTTIFVIGLQLLSQFHELFSKLFDEKIGYVGNGVCDIQRITIASIWTIGSALNMKNIVEDDDVMDEKEVSSSNKEKIFELLRTTQVVILDESHIVTCGTIAEIYKKINPEYIFGFSGTPFKNDGTNLLVTAMLGEQIIDIGASELIAKGLLVQPIIKFLTVPKMHLEGSQTYLNVYKQYVVENDIRNNMIVNETKKLLDKGYNPLILFRQIKHGNILLEKLTDAGIKCTLLSGKDPLEVRLEAQRQYECGEVNVLVTSSIFDIGLDIPKINSLILAGPSKSYVKILQKVGRSLRLYKNKKYSAVIEFYDQIKFLKKHAQIRAEVYASEPGFKVIKPKEMK